jgi:hypothetical protein
MSLPFLYTFSYFMIYSSMFIILGFLYNFVYFASINFSFSFAISLYLY